METTKLMASADGLELAVAFIEPKGAPKGIVQLVHGMCEHKERYYQFMQFLAGEGYVCVIHDHRGHGDSVRSTNDYGYMFDGGWFALVNDIEIVRKWSEERWPALERTLFGHSMGSLAVRSYTKRFDSRIYKLIVCGSPCDNPAAGIAKSLAKMISSVKGDRYRSQLLQKLSFGSFNKPFKKDGYPSAWVCSDKAVLRNYHSDLKCQYIFTANGFYNLMCLMQDCYSVKDWAVSNPDLPILFISGEKDPCRRTNAQHERSVNKMYEVGYLNITSELYPDMRHEILNETKKIEVWNSILDWLNMSAARTFWQR